MIIGEQETEDIVSDMVASLNGGTRVHVLSFDSSITSETILDFFGRLTFYLPKESANIVFTLNIEDEDVGTIKVRSIGARDSGSIFNLGDTIAKCREAGKRVFSPEFTDVSLGPSPLYSMGVGDTAWKEAKVKWD